MDIPAMVAGGVGGAFFGLAISTWRTRPGCTATSCRINGNRRLATLCYGVIGASLGLTLHAF